MEKIDYDKLADKLSEKINQRRKDCDCIYDISPKAHDAHHKMMVSIANIFDKIENIKWDLLKQLARVMLYGAVAIFMIGLSVKVGFIKL